MKPNRQFIVYLIGVALLGVLHEPLKAALGGQWLFVGCVLVYLVALRVLGALIAGRNSEQTHE